MSPNILSAISNIATYRNNDLKSYASTYLIRINAVGEQLEYFIKDAIADSFTLRQEEKEERYSMVFSSLGNQNNPPDAIIKDGDAIEIKKMQTLTAALALNSSPPKDMLYRNDPRLTAECRNAEKGGWESKDIFYVVGSTEKSRVSNLFFVQGTCYAAKKDVYDRISLTLKQDIEQCIKINNIEGGNSTKELGRINRVDPLGITNLRIRGMWTIENPLKVFSYIYRRNTNKSFTLSALMLESKFNSFPQQDIAKINDNKFIEQQTVDIKNPNNPAKREKAKLITLSW